MRDACVGAAVLSMAAVFADQNLSAHAHGIGHGITHDTHEIDHYVNVQPIEICDKQGERCAGTPLFAEETKAIWEKAGIDINFLPTRQINESIFLMATETAIDFGLFSGAPRTGVSADASTINVWFAQDLVYAGGTRFGRGNIGGNKLVLNSSAISGFNNGQGRIDTLAHELGHNLGLFHHHDSDHLLAAGNDRISPESLLDITSGQTSLFSQQEISTILSSPLVQKIPEVFVAWNNPADSNPENLWTVRFLEGSKNAKLTKLTLDLSPVSDALQLAQLILGPNGKVFQVEEAGAGVSQGDITILRGQDDSPKLVIDFSKGNFTAGDSLGFGIDAALFPALESLGLVPGDLSGASLGFEFANGYKTSSVLHAPLLTATKAPKVPEVIEVIEPLSADLEQAVAPEPSLDVTSDQEMMGGVSEVVAKTAVVDSEETINEVSGSLAKTVELVPDVLENLVTEVFGELPAEPIKVSEPLTETVELVPDVLDNLVAEVFGESAQVSETLVEPDTSENLVAEPAAGTEVVVVIDKPAVTVSSVEIGSDAVTTPWVFLEDTVELTPHSVYDFEEAAKAEVRLDFAATAAATGQGGETEPVTVPEPSGVLGMAFGAWILVWGQGAIATGKRRPN